MQSSVFSDTKQNHTHLIDPFGRKMDYLRLAITDRCNLRCQYCMPAEGIPLKSHEHILQYEEMERLVHIFTSLGVNKIRITGGEPFVRKGALDFLKRINALDGLKSINITTNAVLIEDILEDLSQLKIGSLNISIDSLKKDRFNKISRRDDFDKVWANIQRAVKSNLIVKLNMVVLAGINDDELLDFCRLAEQWPIEVRFIEQMPFSGGPASQEVLNADQIVENITQTLPELLEQDLQNSTARIFNHPAFQGKIGVIAGYSRTFCDTCSRLRVTPDGQLKTCLYDYSSVDLRTLMRTGTSDDGIIAAIKTAIKNRAADGFESQNRANQLYNLSMAQIGG
ncbi:MAG: GTP 3',8-cyclase MoaA [Calditrichaeota bacterium]|nr:MAG: GTP 3',8-cyclase MoaA [Calditrichota bacterium]MBL1205715.1 GTP 3',8-cyclase MoaA [Calditrichota bacterium]NOG45543.1 GTP 3',8-cyclase MoaA [Calditrichota bacterium]